MFCKSEVEKACDLGNWGGLSIEEMWFWGEMHDWITYCIFMVRFSVLINRASSCFFDSSRCLRRGSFIPSAVCCCHGGFE